MAEPEFIEAATPEEVFARLSDDTRVAILQTLYTHAEPMTFSDLREAIGMRDSGQFNYHLNTLVDNFVTKTEDGYTLTEAGRIITGAIYGGTFTMDGTLDPIPLDHACPACGGTRELQYEDETVNIECDSCPVGYQFGVPPAAFATYDQADLPFVASQYLRTTATKVANGFCPFCDAHVTPTVQSVAETNQNVNAEEIPDALQDRVDDLPLVEYTCQHCGATSTMGLVLTFLDHPAVVSFYYDRGVDITDKLVWDVAEMNPDAQYITNTDPFRATITYTLDGDTLTITVDADLTIIDIDTPPLTDDPP